MYHFMIDEMYSKFMEYHPLPYRTDMAEMTGFVFGGSATPLRGL